VRKEAGGPPPSKPPHDSQQRVAAHLSTAHPDASTRVRRQPDLRPLFAAGDMACCEDCAEARVTHYTWGYAGQDPPTVDCAFDEHSCPRWQRYGEGLRVAQAVAEAVAAEADEVRRERIAGALYDTLTDTYDHLSFGAFIHAADPALSRGL
jgi:hypothetical protein